MKRLAKQELNLSKIPNLFSDDDLKEEWSNIADKIKGYNQAYDQGKSLIDDDGYDALKVRLFQIEQIIGKQPKSPLYEVGSNLSANKIPHIHPMLSLDHGFTVDAIHRFVKKVSNSTADVFPMIAEHKIDGVAISLRYDGNFVAVTRGNGKEGVDITSQIKFVEIPRSLDLKEVRGELYMTYQEFEKLQYKFSSPRNACAALLQSKTPLPWLKVEFIAYNSYGYTHLTYVEKIAHLQSLGFKTPPNKICANVADCIDFFTETETMRNQNKLPYPIDGIVLKLNSLADWDKLGSHRTGPRYASAIKFLPKSATTVITDIIPQVGKFGVITPVAVFDPVMIEGSKISRATLHNFSEINEKQYGIGDKILVSKAGDTVPYIQMKIAGNNAPFKLINCPSCGSTLTQFEKTLKCNQSWNCTAQKIGRIQHFCSRDAFNIMTLGAKTIEEFVNAGYLNTPLDIFALEDNIACGKIKLKEGWQVKSIQNLIDGINNARNIDMSNFLFALGIPNLGLGQASAIAKCISSFSQFVSIYKNQENFSIKGIGRILIQSIYNFLHDNTQGWIYGLTNHCNIKIIAKSL